MGTCSFRVSMAKSEKLPVTRRIAPDGTVVTVAATTFGSVDGPGSSAQFGHPLGIAMDSKGAFYLTQNGGPVIIRKIVIN